jgi:hypothetical protein
VGVQTQEKNQARQVPSQWIGNSQLTCKSDGEGVNVQLSSLPPEFFVTSQIILNPSGNFDDPLSVVIIFICDSNGSVGVLKQLSQLLCY